MNEPTMQITLSIRNDQRPIDDHFDCSIRVSDGNHTTYVAGCGDTADEAREAAIGGVFKWIASLDPKSLCKIASITVERRGEQ